MQTLNGLTSLFFIQLLGYIGIGSMFPNLSHLANKLKKGETPDVASAEARAVLWYVEKEIIKLKISDGQPLAARKLVTLATAHSIRDDTFIQDC